MIDLTPQDVAEFRELFKRETGRDISDKEARAYALNLVQFVALLLEQERWLSAPPAAGKEPRP